MYLKSRICALLCIFLAFSAQGQFKKGMRMVGAEIGGVLYNSDKTDYTFPSPTTGYSSTHTSYAIGISPSTGWFMNDHTVVGGSLDLSYQYDKVNNESGGRTFNRSIDKGLTIGIGGFLRDYFKTTGGFLPFGQLNLGAGIGSSKTDGFSYADAGYKDSYAGKSSGDFLANAGVAVGVTHLINAHIGLDISVGYVYSYHKYEYKTTTLRDDDLDGVIDETLISNPTVKDTGNGLAVRVGLQVFLDKRSGTR